MHRRFPRLAALTAATLTLAALPHVAQAAEAAPVLWEGIVQTPKGEPAGGASVVAYARPPAGQLQVGDHLAEVARTTADDDGRFTLRTPGGGAMAAAADQSGWTTVMVVATSPAGNSLAIDSLAWQPHEGVQGFSATAGRWITDPAELLAPATAIQEKPAKSIERPAALVLSATKEVRSGTVRPFGSPSRAPGSFCMLTDEKDLGKKPVTIGHMHMERGWSGHFIYTNTKSTSFEVGVSMDGGAFTGKGSRTVTTEAEAGGRDLDDTSTRRNRWYQIAMTFTKYHWRCNEFSGNFEADTIEPGTWGGTNTYHDDNRVPECNAKYTEEASWPKRGFRRQKGSGSVYEAGFSAGGFSGSTSVATSNTVDQLWFNDMPRYSQPLRIDGTPDRNTRW